MPGHFYGNPGLPKQQDPLSAFLMLSRGKLNNMPGIRLAAGVLRKIAKLQADNFGAPFWFFLLGLTPLAFPIH